MSGQLIFIVHNVRSAHNVGSILRSADGFGVSRVYLTGYTPYPLMPNDSRLPHEANKVHNQIKKTALGAELSVPAEHHDSINKLISELKNDGYSIIALEQAPSSTPLPKISPAESMAVIVGRELGGIEKEVLDQVDLIAEIPMSGQKESLNVGVAAAIAMYQLSGGQGGHRLKT